MKLQNIFNLQFLKKGIFFIICSILNAHLFAQISEPKDNLEKVKALNVYLYKVFDVETKKETVTFFKKERTLARFLFEYDENGNEILRNYYNPATNKLHESYVYEYDSNNRMTQELYALQGMVFGGKTLYSYDGQGRKKQSVVYNSKNEVKHTIIFEYDSVGNLIAEKTLNTIALAIKEIQYKYDERNNLIEKRNIKTPYLKKNNAYLEIQSFDDSNRLIGRAHYNEKDSLMWKYTAKYDANNRLVEEETKNGNGKTISYAIYVYNKKGLMESSYSFDMSKKVPPLRIVYKYDKKGLNILRYIYTQNANKPTITKRYYYDDKRNWHMWYEINHEDNTQAIANRKIIYF